jgi:O-antigen/teichoic acid export membrane protein
MQRKWLRRGATILQNAANNLLLPMFNIGISALVIRLTSPELWGEFVSLMVVVQFGAHLVSWGNKDYLLREFSLHPDQISQRWQTSLISRMVLFCLLCGVLVFFAGQRWLVCILWGAGLVLAQSYEVYVLYRRAFAFTFVVEVTGITISAGFVMVRGGALTVDELLLLFAVVSLAKAGAYFVRFTALWKDFQWRIDRGYFGAAAPFFLLGFSGLLASRIDLYSVSYFLSEREVGAYQVFINLMLYIQSLSVFIVGPYARNVYRLPDEAILKISARLFVLGWLFVVPGLVGASLLFDMIYHLHYSLPYLLMGGAFVLPIFAYLPLIYRLYKLNQTGLVLKANLIGAGVNLTLNIMLLPHVGSIGAVAASAVVQWGMLAVYLFEVKGITHRVMPKMSHAD